MKNLVLAVLTMAVVAFAASPAAAGVDECAEVSMTVDATFPNDPGFEGLYKYTVTGCWDVTQFGLSHIDVFLALKTLECICDPNVVKFPVPGGTSDGVGDSGPCTVNYEGLYFCMGDPSIPAELAAPTVKWNALNGECEPGTEGCGTWVFYSPFPPAPSATHEDAVAIKHGQLVCVGDLTGELPMGDCSTPSRPTSWGSMKVTYR
jgi:hypothetical protein